MVFYVFFLKYSFLNSLSDLTTIRLLFLTLCIFFLFLYLYIFIVKIFFSYFLAILCILFLNYFILNGQHFDLTSKYRYVNFHISESFINRNLYIDSNYFLTSDSMRGIEKFSDITSPWLIEHEDFGWGAEFTTQSISSQIIERERRLIIDNMFIDNSPNLETTNLNPGSLKNRLIKLIRRFEVLQYYLNSFMTERQKINNSWKKQNFYRIEPSRGKSVNINYPLRVKFNKLNITSFSTVKLNENKYIIGFNKLMKKNSIRFAYNIKITNEFFLPKKNNILNDSVGTGNSNIKDRKSVVFRNVVNSINTVDNNFDIKSKIPDYNKNSNYIFERQVHEGRLLDYELKLHLKKYIKLRFNYYNQNALFNFNDKIFFNTNFFNKNFNISKNKKNNLTPIDSKYLFNYNKSFEFLKTYKSKYSKLDERLENLTKTLNSELNLHYNYDLDDSEFSYFGGEVREVLGFLDKFGYIDFIFQELLDEKKLKLGLYTYSDFEKKPWDYSRISITDYWRIFYINERLPANYKNSKIFFNLKNKSEFINYITKKFENNYKNTKKHFIFLDTLARVQTSWFYTNTNITVSKFLNFIKYFVSERSLRSLPKDYQTNLIFAYFQNYNKVILPIYYIESHVIDKIYLNKYRKFIRKIYIFNRKVHNSHRIIFKPSSNNILTYFYLNIRKKKRFYKPFITTHYYSNKFLNSNAVNFRGSIRWRKYKNTRYLTSFTFIVPIKPYCVRRDTFDISSRLVKFLDCVKLYVTKDLEYYILPHIKLRSNYFYFDSICKFYNRFFFNGNFYYSNTFLKKNENKYYLLFKFYFYFYFIPVSLKHHAIFLFLNVKMLSFKIYIYFIFFINFCNVIFRTPIIIFCQKIISLLQSKDLLISPKTKFFKFFTNLSLLFYYHINEFELRFIKDVNYSIFINPKTFYNISIFIYNFAINLLYLSIYTDYIMGIDYVNLNVGFNVLLKNLLNIFFLNIFLFLKQIINIFSNLFLNYWYFIFFIIDLFLFEFFLFNFNAFGILFLEYLYGNDQNYYKNYWWVSLYFIFFTTVNFYNVFDLVFLNFLKFSCFLFYYFTIIIIYLGESLSLVENWVVDTVYFYYLTYIKYGFVAIVNFFFVNTIKNYNLWYSRKFSRIVLLDNSYYHNLTTDINDELVKFLSKYIKKKIFYWLGLSKKILNFYIKYFINFDHYLVYFIKILHFTRLIYNTLMFIFYKFFNLSFWEKIIFLINIIQRLVFNMLDVVNFSIFFKFYNLFQIKVFYFDSISWVFTTFKVFINLFFHIISLFSNYFLVNFLAYFDMRVKNYIWVCVFIAKIHNYEILKIKNFINLLIYYLLSLTIKIVFNCFLYISIFFIKLIKLDFIVIISEFSLDYLFIIESLLRFYTHMCIFILQLIIKIFNFTHNITNFNNFYFFFKLNFIVTGKFIFYFNYLLNVFIFFYFNCIRLVYINFYFIFIINLIKNKYSFNVGYFLAYKHIYYIYKINFLWNWNCMYNFFYFLFFSTTGYFNFILLKYFVLLNFLDLLFYILNTVVSLSLHNYFSKHILLLNFELSLFRFYFDIIFYKLLTLVIKFLTVFRLTNLYNFEIILFNFFKYFKLSLLNCTDTYIFVLFMFTQHHFIYFNTEILYNFYKKISKTSLFVKTNQNISNFKIIGKSYCEFRVNLFLNIYLRKFSRLEFYYTPKTLFLNYNLRKNNIMNYNYHLPIVNINFLVTNYFFFNKKMNKLPPAISKLCILNFYIILKKLNLAVGNYHNNAISKRQSYLTINYNNYLYLNLFPKIKFFKLKVFNFEVCKNNKNNELLENNQPTNLSLYFLMYDIFYSKIYSKCSVIIFENLNLLKNNKIKQFKILFYKLKINNKTIRSDFLKNEINYKIKYWDFIDLVNLKFREDYLFVYSYLKNIITTQTTNNMITVNLDKINFFAFWYYTNLENLKYKFISNRFKTIYKKEIGILFISSFYKKISSTVFFKNPEFPNLINNFYKSDSLKKSFLLNYLPTDNIFFKNSFNFFKNIKTVQVLNGVSSGIVKTSPTDYQFLHKNRLNLNFFNLISKKKKKKLFFIENFINKLEINNFQNILIKNSFSSAYLSKFSPNNVKNKFSPIKIHNIYFSEYGNRSVLVEGPVFINLSHIFINLVSGVWFYFSNLLIYRILPKRNFYIDVWVVVDFLKIDIFYSNANCLKNYIKNLFIYKNNKIHKYGYFTDNKLYRFLLIKVLFFQPIFIHKLSFEILFNFNIFKILKQNLFTKFIFNYFKNIIMFEFKYIDNNILLNIFLINLLDFYTSKFIIIYYTLLLDLFLWFQSTNNTALVLYKNIQQIHKTPKIQLFFYPNQYLYTTFIYFINFLNINLYIDYFIDDFIIFQLVSKNKIFTHFVKFDDIHVPTNTPINEQIKKFFVNFLNLDLKFWRFLYFRWLYDNLFLNFDKNSLLLLYQHKLIYLEKYLLILRQIIYSIFFEVRVSNNKEYNIFLFLKFFYLLEDIIELFFENIHYNHHHHIHNLAQTVWLELTIVFDHLFEYFTEIDYEQENSPFSNILEHFLNLFFAAIRGEPFNELDYTSFDFENWSGVKSAFFENDNFHGLSDINHEDGLSFLGWGFKKNLGINPGNEFSTLNDISEIPELTEKLLLFDINDFYNNLFGFDNPQLGNLYPSFDISLPVKAFWILGIVYYSPDWGGAALIDTNALWSFFKILYIDRRSFSFSIIYTMFNYYIYNFNLPGIVFFKIKFLYVWYDFFQILDSIYLNIFDFMVFWFFYPIYIFDLVGLSFFISLFLTYSLLLKINNIFEKKEKNFKRNNYSILYYFINMWSYIIFRFIYLFLSNITLFLKMSISIFIILVFGYVFTEGLHLLSILRVFDTSQESTLFLNGQYFILERDPFVEKNNPIDEIQDNYKYESDVDDDWSRIHFYRENTEILGGKEKENPTVIDSIGFAKKFNIEYDIYDDPMEIYSTPGIDSRGIVDQIHNNIQGEYTFLPNFNLDSELEREFFRESELYGEEVIGSLDYLNRSENKIQDIWNDSFFEDLFYEQNIQGGFEFEEEDEKFNNELYGALIMNIADPKWMYNYSPSLTIRELTPQIIGNSQTQLYSNNINKKSHIYDKLYTQNIAKMRLVNLIKRNKGIFNQNPILDFYDEDSYSDLGFDLNEDFGTSLGSISNLIDVWDDHTADPITQLTRHSNNPAITDSILFNYTSTDEVLPLNYYSGEDFIFENFFDSVFNTKIFGFEDITTSEVFDNAIDDDSFYEEIDSDSYDNFFPRIGRFSMIEDNYKSKNFVNNSMPEGYFNLTSYIFKDLKNNNTSNIVANINQTSLNLENIRKRDRLYYQPDGIQPINMFYDDMVSEDLDKLTYYNIENTNANWGNTTYYKNNEFSQKLDLSQKNIWWTPRLNEYKIFFEDYEYGHLDIYNNSIEENDYSLADFLNYDNQENWFIPEIYHDRILNLKSVMKKRKWNPQRSLVSNYTGLYKNINKLWFTKPSQKHKNLASFIIQNNTLANYSNELAPSNTNKYKLFKNFEKITPTELNTLIKKINTKPKKKKGSAIPDKLFNRPSIKYFIESLRNRSSLTYQQSTASITFLKKWFNIFNLLNFDSKRIYTTGIDKNQKSKNEFLSKYIYKPTQTTNNFYNLANDTTKSLIKNKISTVNPKSELFMNFDFSENTYNSKIEQYLNAFEDKTYDTNGTSDYILDDFADMVYFDNKWSVDQLGKINYELFTDSNSISNVNWKFSKLKNLRRSVKSDFTALNKKITNSSKFREYAKSPSRGYWSRYKDDISQDERMVGILSPKTIENPIFLSDSEAFRDYSEIWNIDFARKDNNLDIMGMGMPRDLTWYDEHTNNQTFDPIVSETPIESTWFGDEEEDEDYLIFSDIMGISDLTNLDIEDSLRDGLSWYGFNFDIGKNWYKYRMSNFSKILEKKLASKEFLNKINWFDFKKYDTDRVKTPWGLDISKNTKFIGSQNWNFQKNDENFINLLENGNFKIFTIERPLVSSLSKIKANSNFFLKNRPNAVGVGSSQFLNNHNGDFEIIDNLMVQSNPDSDLKTTNELLNNQNSILNLDLAFKKKIQLNNSFDLAYNNNNYDRLNTSNFDIIKKSNNSEVYFIDYEPDILSTNTDANWDVDLKFDYATKFYQYGKMFKSLEQASILQEHFKSNIALDNTAITPDQASDYFWYVYKKYKKNKMEIFFKKIDYSRDIPTHNKIIKQNFENFIKSPVSNIANFELDKEDLLGFSVEHEFPNLADSWDSSYIETKLSYDQFDDSMPVKDFELFDIEDLNYQNVNDNNSWARRNKKFKNTLLRENKRYLDWNLSIKKSKEDISLLYDLAENTSDSLNNNSIWWTLYINKNFKNVKQIVDNYMYNNLFGLYLKKWKSKKNVFKETNSQLRYEQVKNLLYNNINHPEWFRQYSRYNPNFSRNESLVNAISGIAQLSNYNYNTKSIFDTQKKENNLDFFDDTSIDNFFLENNFDKEININTPETNDMVVELKIQKDFNKEFFNTINYLDLDENLLDAEIDFEDLDDIFDLENKNQTILTYFHNKKYNNIFENFENFKIDTFNNNPITHNFIKIDDFSENKSWDFMFNKVNPTLKNYSKWSFNVSDQEFDIEYPDSYITEDLRDNSTTDNNLPNYSSEISNFKFLINFGNDFENDFDDEIYTDSLSDNFLDLIEDVGTDLHYYNNKKINSYQNFGIDHRNYGITKPTNINKTVITAKNSTSSQFLSTPVHNDFDYELLEPEDSSIYFNNIFYYKNSYKNYNKVINNIPTVFKKKLKKNIFNNTLVNQPFLSKNFDINSLSNTDISMKSNKKVFGLDSKLNIYKNNKKLYNIFNNFGNSNTYIKNFKLDSNFNNFFSENQNFLYKNTNYFDSNLIKDYISLWKNKNYSNFNINIIKNDFGSDTYKNTINKISKNNNHINNSINIVKNNIYIDKSSKSDPVLGDNRFNNLYNPDWDQLNNNNLYKLKKTKVSNVNKSENFGFIKLDNGVKNYDKDIYGFYKNIFNNNSNSDLNYLQNISIPTYKNIFNKNIDSGSQYFLINKKHKYNDKGGDLFINTDNQVSLDTNYNDNNYLKWNNNRKLGSIFKTNHQFINSKDEKVSDNFRNFAYNESVYPLPITKSLSIDSNLFNKISSLRIYGAGKLSDYFYNTKLKHILNSETQYYDFDDDTDINYSDDQFLLVFDEEDGDVFWLKDDEFEYNDEVSEKLTIDNTSPILKKQNYVLENYNFDDLEDSQSQTVISKKHMDMGDLVMSADQEDYSDIFETDTELEADVLYNFIENEKLKEERYSWLNLKYFFNKESNYLNNDYELWHYPTQLNENYNDTSKFNLGNFDDTDDFDILSTNIDFIDSLSLKKIPIKKNNSNANINFQIPNNFEDILIDTYEEIFDQELLRSDQIDLEKLEIKNSNNAEEILEGFENLQDITDFVDTQNMYTINSISNSIPGSEFVLSDNNLHRNNINLNFENQFNILDIEDLETQYVSNTTVDGDFFEEYFDNSEDFEDITNFVASRFLTYEIPSEKLDYPLDFFTNHPKMIPILSNQLLNDRKNKLFTGSITLKNKNLLNNRLLNSYPLDKNTNVNFREHDLVQKNQQITELNWFLNREYWSNIMEEYEQNKALNSPYKYDSTVEQSTLDNLHNINYLENFETLNLLSSYFTNNNTNITTLGDFDTVVDNLQITETDGVGAQNKLTDFIFKNSNSNTIWNLKNNSNRGWWLHDGNKGLVKIPPEIGSNSDLKEILAKPLINYVFKKNVLNLKSENLNSNLNISTMLRKSNSTNIPINKSGQFKNLKKKYWSRMDIVERYINNIKFSINNTAIKDNISNKLKKQNKKLIHIDVLSNLKLRYNKQSNIDNNHFILDNTQHNKINDTAVDYLYLQNKNRLLTINTDQNIANFEAKPQQLNFTNNYLENLWNSIGSKIQHKVRPVNLKYKPQKYSKFYDTFFKEPKKLLEISNFLNDGSFFNSNKDYLDFKSNSTEIEIQIPDLSNYKTTHTNIDEVFDDDDLFDEDDDDDDEDDDEDDIYDIYSKIRNDLQKLETNKYSNNYLPISVVSSFLSKVPNLNISNYINDVPKNVNYYKSISNHLERGSNNLLTNSQESFVSKEARKSIKRINNIEYFKKQPVIDQFGIYHKKLQRPGLDLKNKFSTLPIDPFRKFSSNAELYSRSIKYGSGSYIFKNSPVNRRSYDLVTRTFGPDIITNSTLLGYGRFDFISDQNQNDDEDSGVNDNIGYPIINEQNLYNYEYPDIVDTYKDETIFSMDFLDFMFKTKDEDDSYIDILDNIDNYEDFFDLTEGYKRLPLFSIFLPSDLNYNKYENYFEDFPIIKDIFSANEDVVLNSSIFQINPNDVLSSFDKMTYSDENTFDITDVDDFTDDDIDFDGDDEEYEYSNYRPADFFNETASFNFFDLTPLSIFSYLRWLEYADMDYISNSTLDDEGIDNDEEDMPESPESFIYSTLFGSNGHNFINEGNLPNGFIEPAFNTRYFQTWNTTIEQYFEPKPESSDILDSMDFDEDEDDEVLDKYSEVANTDLTEEESDGKEPITYRYPYHTKTPYDIISKLKTETEYDWIMPGLDNERNLNYRDTENPELKITSKIYNDDWEHNIGPLGFEEGDTIFENRMLNRGWYPEKIIWNWGMRDQSRIGNDLNTLELLSDYRSSFSHEEENFSNDPEEDALLSLSWAGKNNKLFNIIDDIVEGFGIEENLPFSPEIARKLSEYEFDQERYTYDENNDIGTDHWYWNEDDEEEFYVNYDNPESFYHYKDELFNTLGFLRYESETNAWQDTNYVGNLDSIIISGSSMPLADNTHYDGLMTDFSNFIYEKFPTDPKNNLISTSLPQTTEGLFSAGDYQDSPIPGFADYIIDDEAVEFNYDYEEPIDHDYENPKDSMEKEENFNLLETFKPKDSFNLSPNDSGFLTFEPEWVVDGEGWLGNTGSSLKIFDKENLNNNYLNPQQDKFSMPKGIHSFEVLDDEDILLGTESAYFSLSDFQKNRIIRGRDNDISNFPIKSGWNLQTGFTPEWHNLFWKHRMHFGDDKFRTFIDVDKFFYQVASGSTPTKTGIGIPLTDTLLDNQDFLVFNSIEMSQRNLWWKSVSNGYLTDSSKLNLNINVLFDNNESYRDFLLSYDYKVFGKSWLNPQNVNIPQKTFNFYGDTQINNWLQNTNFSDTNTQLDLENNYSIFDFTYGYFANSQTNFDSNRIYFSVQLRSILYKIYHIFGTYFSYSFYSLVGLLNFTNYYFIDFFINKFCLVYTLLKIISTNNVCITLNSIFMIKYLFNFLYKIFLFIFNLVIQIEYLIYILFSFSYLNFEYLFFNYLYTLKYLFFYFYNFLNNTFVSSNILNSCFILIIMALVLLV